MLSTNYDVTSVGIQVLFPFTELTMNVSAALRGTSNRRRNSVVESTVMRRRTWLYLGASLSGVSCKAPAVGCLRTEAVVLQSLNPRAGIA